MTLSEDRTGTSITKMRKSIQTTIVPSIAFALGFLVSRLMAIQARPVEAWWLNATFQATETSYESLAVTDIDSTWVRMSALGYASLPAEAQSDLGWMRRDGFVFVVDTVSKRPGIIDRAVT